MNMTGKKVTLKAIQEEDLPFLMDVFNDPQTAATVEGWSPPVSLYQQREWFASIGKNPHCVRYSVWENEGNRLIGSCSLANVDMKNRTAEIACRLHAEKIGKGSGTDAVYLLLVSAFDYMDLSCVQATHLASNQYSLGVTKKLGFTCEGSMRSRIFKHGQRHDLFLHSILADEFRSTKKRYENGEI